MQEAIDIEAYLDELSVSELEALYSELYGYDFHPVGISEFLVSDKYLGNFFQEGCIYPYWLKTLEEIYPSPFFSPYWLIALRGAIGTGKTTIACAGIAYDTYLLLSMSSPQKMFNLIPSTTILFAIFNVTMTLSHDVVWGTLSQMFATSPFFASYMRERQKKDDTLFPKNIDFFMGSRIGHTLGRNVISAILDEANFEILHGQVYENFNSLLRRMESRFMQMGGGLAGRIWVVSSETDKSSTINKIVDSYKNKSGVYVSQTALWDVKPHHYSGKRFPVFVGTDVKAPEIIDEMPQELTEEFLLVPEEHRNAFEADIHAALRDLAGRSTTAKFKLFRLRDKLGAAFKVTPLFPEIIKLDFDDDADQILNYLLFKNYFSNFLNSNYPRFIHLDLGLSGDRCGIAASYVVKYREVLTMDIATYQNVVETLPDVVTEWAFALEAKSGRQIPLFKIRTFLNFLIKQNYPIAKVTADGFQSADMLQYIEKMGIDSSILSLDRSTTPYIAFRNAVYETRVQLPISTLLHKELLDLELSSDASKIDHPKGGSKDLADAVAGSVYSAFIGAERIRLLYLIEEEKPKPNFDFKELFWKEK